MKHYNWDYLRTISDLIGYYWLMKEKYFDRYQQSGNVVDLWYFNLAWSKLDSLRLELNSEL